MVWLCYEIIAQLESAEEGVQAGGYFVFFEDFVAPFFRGRPTGRRFIWNSSTAAGGISQYAPAGDSSLLAPLNRPFEIQSRTLEAEAPIISAASFTVNILRALINCH
ncbi:MAG TPA: hypothetical protein VI756_15925 [Blastocatellia bacterium]